MGRRKFSPSEILIELHGTACYYDDVKKAILITGKLRDEGGCKIKESNQSRIAVGACPASRFEISDDSYTHSESSSLNFKGVWGARQSATVTRTDNNINCRKMTAFILISDTKTQGCSAVMELMMHFNGYINGVLPFQSTDKYLLRKSCDLCLFLRAPLPTQHLVYNLVSASFFNFFHEESITQCISSREKK